MAQFYTLDEAARVLGMNPEELKAKAQHREIRAFMDSGTWRFRVADIDELARRRGMGSDPDLSLSDLDLAVQQDTMAESGSEDINLSEYQLGVASPDLGGPDSVSAQPVQPDEDVLLDDRSLPPGEVGGSSSTIIGMMNTGKQPSDSDVRLVPDNVDKAASDSDVRLAGQSGSGSDVRPAELGGGKGKQAPSDSDVTLVAPEQDSDFAEKVDVGSDPGETTLQPSPFMSDSSEEVEVTESGQDSDSDFELTPSSVIDALQPESGSDFELTALDASDEFEATPQKRGPSDSDVTGAEPSISGINLGRPSDSGINLQSVGGAGGFNLESADSIELAPLDEDDGPAARAPAPKPKPVAPKPESKVDLSATALPMKADKDIFEDTDFEVDALDSDGDGPGGDDRTMQLEAQSDFDLEDSDSASEVFAIDEEDVDQNAATAMAPAVLDEDEAEGAFGEEGTSGETSSAWDVEEGAAVAAATPSRPSPVLASSAASPEWGGLWVGLLGFATFLMLMLAFVGMDVVRNLHSFHGDGPASGLVKALAGLGGGG